MQTGGSLASCCAACAEPSSVLFEVGPVPVEVGPVPVEVSAAVEVGPAPVEVSAAVEVSVRAECLLARDP